MFDVKKVLIATGVLALTSCFTPGAVVSAKKEKVKSRYFSEAMDEGEEIKILTHGPFRVYAECSTTEGESQARLLLKVNAKEGDEWVYGFPDFAGQDWFNECVGHFAEGTSEKCVVASMGSGVSFTGGSTFQSLSGYYVSFDADSTVGFHKAFLEEAGEFTGYDADDIAALPNEVTCLMSGVVTYNDRLTRKVGRVGNSPYKPLPINFP